MFKHVLTLLALIERYGGYIALFAILFPLTPVIVLMWVWNYFTVQRPARGMLSISNPMDGFSIEYPDCYCESEAHGEDPACVVKDIQVVCKDQ